MEAYCCDLYVATLDAMSLKGMVSTGFSGPHELVSGGFKQASDEGRVLGRLLGALFDGGGLAVGRCGGVWVWVW